MPWIERKVHDPDLVQRLSLVLNELPLPLARALVLRGVDSLDSARTYFRATLEETHDPRLLSTMDDAASRLSRAIREKERVLVYGDFDADGVTSTALVVDFLRRRGVLASYFIPSRFEDGYGFHERGVTTALAQEASLLVVVDCGTTAVETAALARKLGLDVIICDHHENADAAPPCIAHVNPKRNECAYPFKELSACGLAFKVVQATLALLGEPPDAAREYLEFVALSTVCDLVPLCDENRILVREGLDILRSTSRCGLRALMNVAGVNAPDVRSTDIAMRLGPRLNAAGRLAHSSIAVELLLANTHEQAAALASELEDVNNQRRDLGKEVERLASMLARTQLAGAHTQALVLYHPEWHPGVLGPAASRIVSAFGRPTVLLANDPRKTSDTKTWNGQAVGSARSVEELNMHEALQSCSELLTRFGGHAQAAGLTLPADDIPRFRERLNAYTKKHLHAHSLVPRTTYDASLAAVDISDRFVSVLKQCEPFGKGNEEPLFYVTDLCVASARPTRTGEHLLLTVKTPGGERRLNAVAFWHGDKFTAMEEARIQQSPIEILCAVSENTYNGRTRVQLRVEELRVANVTYESSGP